MYKDEIKTVPNLQSLRMYATHTTSLKQEIFNKNRTRIKLRWAATDWVQCEDDYDINLCLITCCFNIGLLSK